MNKPRIYGFCPAGCKWEAVHKSDFDAAKASVPILERTSDHTHHLLNSDINLLEENPYFDLTQHFKIYDGTAGFVEGRNGSIDPTNWNVKLHAVLYVDGRAVDAEEIAISTAREEYGHEIDLIIKSVDVRIGESSSEYESKIVDIVTSFGTKTLSTGNIKGTAPEKITLDIYVENLGYPHDKDGVMTERVDGCENTEVYSIGYGNGIDVASYVAMQLEGIDTALDSILAIQETLAPTASLMPDGEIEPIE